MDGKEMADEHVTFLKQQQPLSSEFSRSSGGGEDFLWR